MPRVTYARISDIRDHRPRAILAIQAQECALCGKALGFYVRLDSLFGSAQFLAILPMARVAEAGHPLMRVHMQDRGTCPNDFTPLASGVARGTKRT